MHTDGNIVFELILIIALVVAVYVLSLKINPYVRCSRCKNNPKRKGLIFNYAHHICSKCKGTGQQVRFGYKLLGMGRSGQPPPP
jgi:hypothetical protein